MAESYLANHRVEFRDTDAAGIMHFSSFLTYMEESEHAFLRSIGFSVMNCEVAGIHISWPRVSVKCDYQKPLRFEDEFTVSVSVKKLGGKSVTYGFAFSHQSDQIAVGEMTVVCCALNDQGLQAIDIPPSIREKLTAYWDVE